MTLNASPSSETRTLEPVRAIFEQPVSLWLYEFRIADHGIFSCAAVSTRSYKQCVPNGVVPQCPREEDVG